MTSVFLELPRDRQVASNDLAFAIRDSYPVTEGHTLVITRRVVATWFDASPAEQRAVLALVDVVKAALGEELHPDGHHVGFDVGAAGGQTVPHLHVHVIPRYHGDIYDPRGGVRHVLPTRGNYERGVTDWSTPPGPGRMPRSRVEPLTTGAPGPRLGAFLGALSRRADEATIVSAFVQSSGLDVLEPRFEEFLRRGGALRPVTGDYLHITQADALQRLLDLHARTRAFALADDDAEDEAIPGTFEVSVVETEHLRRSFHPMAWLFAWGADPKDGVAYVGSSNLSRSALEHGVEWNLRVERRLDPEAWDRVASAAAGLWSSSRPFDADWLAAYRLRARDSQRDLPPGDVEDEAGPPPEPLDIQVEALRALRESRESGQRRALVVLATGLGKTFLAAFDVAAFADDMERSPRILLLPHRRELLTQAATTFRRVLPESRFSWCVGGSSDLTGDVVLASVQKLSRPAVLSGLPPDWFDYVIIDEVHHAAAASYRRVIDALEPGFLLGLTATPDRADEADVVGLFDDHVRHEQRRLTNEAVPAQSCGPPPGAGHEAPIPPHSALMSDTTPSPAELVDALRGPSPNYKRAEMEVVLARLPECEAALIAVIEELVADPAAFEEREGPTSFALLYVLHLLARLPSEAAHDPLLALLRLPPEVVENWLEGAITEDLAAWLFATSGGRPEGLEALARSQEVEAWTRGAAMHALLMLADVDPSLRDRTIELARDLLQDPEVPDDEPVLADAVEVLVALRDAGSHELLRRVIRDGRIDPWIFAPEDIDAVQEEPKPAGDHARDMLTRYLPEDDPHRSLSGWACFEENQGGTPLAQAILEARPDPAPGTVPEHRRSAGHAATKKKRKAQRKARKKQRKGR